MSNINNTRPDASDAADAARMRWLLSGNGYFMEEEYLCGRGPCDQEEQDRARLKIDEAMRMDGHSSADTNR